LLSAFDSGEDALWVGGPDEGFGIGVCLGAEAVDSDLQVDDGSEHAALEATARGLGEEASTALSQDAEVGVKWNVQRGCLASHWRLKSMAIRSGDVHDNSCSHAESMNCFGRFGNRPNESDH
jgi:hypothetical protein